MNELLVMRHAKSDWSAHASDFDRPLNERGHDAADRMATWLVENDLEPDRIVSSAAVRTATTAQAIADRCGLAADDIVFDRELYLASAFTWRQRIARQDQARVLVCGHNPGVDDLVEALSPEPVPLTRDGKLMTTAAIAYFRLPGPWSTIDAGDCEFVQLVRPREL